MDKKDKKIIDCIKDVSVFFKGTGFWLFLYFLTALSDAVLGVLFPILSSNLINNITGGLMHQVLMTSLMILIIEFVGFISTYFKIKMYRKISNKVVVDIQKNVISEVFKIKTSEVDKNTSGLFIDRLNKDAGDLGSVFIEISYWLTNLMGKIGILVSIFILNKIIFVFSLITSIISFFLTKNREEFMYSNNKKIKKLNEEKTGIISETIRGTRDIKVLNATDSLLNRIMDKVKEVTYKGNELYQQYILIGQINNAISSVFSFTYIIICIYLYSIGQITIPVFITLYYFRSRSLSLIDGISKLFSYLKNFQLSYNRVNEILQDYFIKEKFGNTNVDKLEGHIEFKNVSFSYDKSKVLNKMSFKIEPNQKVAFVGKSGAGKTTLFSLITKLYDINSGDILLDGHSINDLTKDSIRNNISLITQNPYIFNFTIKENFTAIKGDASLKDIRRVCKLARIDDFIMSLPDKYDTKLGEGGVILSGGQRQRLAIARALLLNTEIILFDEATSALDNETQQEITEAINNMQGEYTILIVAHRLSTIINCDKIFVVDNGKILAEGTHKELMNSCKFYKDLYQQEL